MSANSTGLLARPRAVEYEEDRLARDFSAARGVVLGLLICAPFWLALVALAALWLALVAVAALAGLAVL